jgi:hypothetical protein
MVGFARRAGELGERSLGSLSSEQIFNREIQLSIPDIPQMLTLPVQKK